MQVVYPNQINILANKKDITISQRRLPISPKKFRFTNVVVLYANFNCKFQKYVSDMMKKFHEINIQNDYNLSYDMKPKNNTKHIIYTTAVEYDGRSHKS